MQNSFFLVPPPQTKNLTMVEACGEDALNKWIMYLPTANPILTATLCCHFICELNKTEMSVQLRVDTLETLRNIVSEIEDFLRIEGSKIGFPKKDSGQKMMDVLVQIETEYTLAYWIIVKELTRRRATGWFQGKNVALSIQRTIKGLGALITTYNLMCLAIPDWIWIDLHGLYKLSVQLKKHKVKIPDDLDNPSDMKTVEGCYQHILLLSLIDCRRLILKEIQQLDNFLIQFNDLVLLQQSPIIGQKIQCIVWRDEDIPPKFECKQQLSTSEKLYLDVSPLHKKIKQMTRRTGRFNLTDLVHSKKQPLSPELVHYVEQYWSGVEINENSCFIDRLDRLFSIGLETSCQLLSPDTIQRHKKGEYLAQSSSKYALSCLFNRKGLIFIGSLISFRKTTEPQHQRALGIVNKIMVLKHGSCKIDFEIKLITTKIYAMSYKLKDHEEKQQQSLFYTKQENNQEKWFIIINSYLLKERDMIELANKFWVELTHKKNIGLGYWQFECKRIAKITT